jgi:hypothetical protein
MSTQTKLPQKTLVAPETRQEPRPQAATPETKVARSSTYWGDRITLLFWLFCFGLMLMMSLVEALHRFVLYLMGR